MERYPDPDDAGRRYPLMPPDFDLRDNVMNKEYEVFERRFRDACHFFVCDMTGVSPWPQVQQCDTGLRESRDVLVVLYSGL